MFLKKESNNKISFFESTITIKADNRVQSVYSDLIMTIVSFSPENESNPFDRVITCKWIDNEGKKEGQFKLIELRDALEKH